MAHRHSIQVSRRAANQIRKAARWWERHRPLAPTAVIDDVEQAFDLLSIRPGIGSRARSSSPPELRRILLGRIGYHLYYVHSNESRTVLILALWHVRRGSGPSLGVEPD